MSYTSRQTASISSAIQPQPIFFAKVNGGTPRIEKNKGNWECASLGAPQYDDMLESLSISPHSRRQELRHFRTTRDHPIRHLNLGSGGDLHACLPC